MNRIPYYIFCSAYSTCRTVTNYANAPSCASWFKVRRVEYAGGRIKYGILFIFSLFHEHSNLEYVHIHVICRVHQAEYVIRVRVAASQKYVNTYSTRMLRPRP